MSNSESITHGPYNLDETIPSTDGIIATIDDPDQMMHLYSTRHTVKEGQAEKNGELIMAAFGVAEGLKHTDRDPVDVIRAASAIVEAEEAEGDGDGEAPEGSDPAPRPEAVEQELAKAPDEGQNMMIASSDDQVALYWDGPMRSVVLSGEEAKRFAGQLLNHARGTATNGTS